MMRFKYLILTLIAITLLRVEVFFPDSGWGTVYWGAGGLILGSVAYQADRGKRGD